MIKKAHNNHKHGSRPFCKM